MMPFREREILPILRDIIIIVCASAASSPGVCWMHATVVTNSFVIWIGLRFVTNCNQITFESVKCINIKVRSIASLEKVYILLQGTSKYWWNNNNISIISTLSSYCLCGCQCQDHFSRCTHVLTSIFPFSMYSSIAPSTNCHLSWAGS